MYRDPQTMKMPSLALAAASLLAAETAAAEQFQPLRDQRAFVGLVQGRDLTRFGIRLEVTPAGEIKGSAFGTPVTGEWRWQDGFFCRELYWGERDLGPNCQEVQVNGETLRFISDRGEGMFADLSLE
jgi:hypothetical protein